MLLDVGIVGCGTAGPALALFLARAGHRVTLYEAVEEPQPIGAGVMIQPTGLAVLDRLGLAEPILARSARVQRLHCRTAGGRAVIDLAYGDLAPGLFGVGMHRGVSFEALWGTLPAAGVQVRAGLEISAFERRRDGVLLRAGSLELGPHQLLVVADGARSKLRAQVPHRARPYPWGALWFVADDRAQAFDGELFQVVSGTREMLGFLPSGLGPRGDVPQVSLFWSLPADQVEHFRRAGLAPWRERVLELEPRAEPIVAQIDGVDQLLFARYWDVQMAPHHDGVVFLGDAAHAMSPQLGQGVNLALVDAMTLADCLAEHPELPRALHAYAARRRAHLAYYQWATRFLTPFFQSGWTPLGWLRDTFMGPACKLPHVRTRMIRTMCGLERGVLLANPLPLPERPLALTAGQPRAA